MNSAFKVSYTLVLFILSWLIYVYIRYVCRDFFLFFYFIYIKFRWLIFILSIVNQNTHQHT